MIQSSIAIEAFPDISEISILPDGGFSQDRGFDLSVALESARHEAHG
jgi:hypothetical protein